MYCTVKTHSEGFLVTMTLGLLRQDLKDWARLGSVTVNEDLKRNKIENLTFHTFSLSLVFNCLPLWFTETSGSLRSSLNTDALTSFGRQGQIGNIQERHCHALCPHSSLDSQDVYFKKKLILSRSECDDHYASVRRLSGQIWPQAAQCTVSTNPQAKAESCSSVADFFLFNKRIMKPVPYLLSLKCTTISWCPEHQNDEIDLP